MRKAPGIGDLLALNGSPATAEQVAERQRLKSKDSDLLRVVKRIEDGVETEIATLRRDHVIDLCKNYVEQELVGCDTADPAERLEDGKGRHVGLVADYIFGSREQAYTDYVKRLLPYAGPVDLELNDGFHCHVDNHGIVFRTDNPDAVEGLFASFAEGQASTADKAVARSVKRVETARDLSAKRVPALKDVLNGHSEKTQVSLQMSILARLKALESPTKAKKTA